MVVWTEEEAEEWAKENELLWKVNNTFNEVIRESRKSEREEIIEIIKEETEGLIEKFIDGCYNLSGVDRKNMRCIGAYLEHKLIEKIRRG